MNRRLVLTLAAVALASCATTASPQRAVVAPSAQPYAELEPIFAVSSAYEAISIRVSSNGCTTKADFVFHVERRDGSASVAFARRRLDTCKSFAAGHTDLIFTFEELGLPARQPLFVLNPFEPWFGPKSVETLR
jgi:hypothetical protein